MRKIRFSSSYLFSRQLKKQTNPPYPPLIKGDMDKTNPPYPPLKKGENIVSPFEKGGLRRISLVFRQSVWLLSFFLAALLFLSCSKDEKIIDNSNNQWKVLVSRIDGQPVLSLYQQPDGKLLDNDVFYTANNTRLSSPVRKMAEYRNVIYLFMPDEYKITAIDKVNFKVLAVIDLSSGRRIPSDICFPNATDAYVAHENSQSVSLIDITTFTVARRIGIGGNAVAIAAAGNQILAACQKQNSIVVIDSRTHEQTSAIPVAPLPTYVQSTFDGKVVIAVSLGNGKLDTSQQKSDAIATLINVETKSKIAELLIGLGGYKPLNQFPTGLATTGDFTGFVSTQEAMFRIYVKQTDRVGFIEANSYSSVIYNYRRDEMLLVKKTGDILSGSTADKITGEILQTLVFPINFLCLLPL